MDSLCFAGGAAPRPPWELCSQHGGFGGCASLTVNRDSLDDSMVQIYIQRGVGDIGVFLYFCDILVMVHYHSKLCLSSFNLLENVFSVGHFGLMMLIFPNLCCSFLNY